LGLAGDVSISTPGNVSVGGGTQVSQIASSSSASSIGEPGNVTISAGTLFVGANGLITVEDDGSRLAQGLTFPSKISVRAGSIVMDGGAIDARSTGNVDASAIDINYDKSLTATDASITTSAAQGNGGAITINGSGILWLNRSQISTSVLGPNIDPTIVTSSNGGNIAISAPFIVMNTAAIQANTNVPLASGGNINIEARGLVPSYGSFTLGGVEQAFNPAQPGLNLVQAVAPNGVSGTLNVTTPTLDVGNSLVALKGVPAAVPSLGRSPCAQTAGNTLSLNGRGGLLPSTRGPLWSALDPGTPPKSDPNTPTSNKDRSSLESEYSGSAPTDLSRNLLRFGQLSPCTISATTTTNESSPSL
jgi:hypothetical protein